MRTPGKSFLELRRAARPLLMLFAAIPLASPAFCQDSTASDPPAEAPPPRHVLWIIPNFRTSPSLTDYKPISVKEKFRIGTLDSFDRGTLALGLLFGAQAELTASNPSFGHGIGETARYMATGYTDYVVGNYMTESIFPSLLHQDPRYFRRGTGGTWKRMGYAMGQIFVTHGDSGRLQFNASELGGNAAAVAISMAYYADGRTAGNATTKFALQVGLDMASGILKEFWPDLERKFSHKRP